MITVLSGENSYELTRQLGRLTSDFEGAVEKIDGSELDLAGLPDLLMGGTLFADKRLVIIRNLSDNKAIWPEFGTWLEKLSPDISLVLIEPSPDKRTKTYKQLTKTATIHDFPAWSDRDTAKAEQYVASESAARGIVMDKKSVRTLVERAGVDQWRLSHALDKLAALGEATPEIITDVIEAQPGENALNLFETAVRGDQAGINRILSQLRPVEDVYRLFGLLTGQAFGLLTAAMAPSDANPAKDFGIHPYALSKIKPYAAQLGRSGSKKIVTILAEADDLMKTSGADPWLLVESALVKIAALK